MKKKEYINFLRFICCLFVIMIHVIEGWLITNPKINDFRFLFDCVLIQPFIRTAVPIFVMISGSLLLNPDKNISIDKLKTYISKMILILLTFGLFYCTIESIFNFGFSNMFLVIKTSIKNLFEEKSWAHLWYIYMLIGLYIITPILREFVKNDNKKNVNFILISLFILSVFIPTFNQIFNLQITTFKLNSLVYIFIYLLGYYIANTSIISKKMTYICGVIGFIGYLLMSYYLKINSQNNLFVILESIFIFYTFSKSNIKSNKFINLVADNSLGIYIIHAFWLNIINKAFNIYPDILPIFIGEFIFLIVTFILSLFSSMILKKIPFIKKIV